MIKYILKRIGLMIPVLIGVIFVVFTINRVMPGDPAVSIAGPNAAPEVYEQIREDLGLNEPFLVQFFNYLKDIVTKFDLGTSYQTGRSVTTEILDRCPSTIILGLVGVAITVILGIPFGIISATKQYSPLDYGVTFTSLILASMPGFWLALILMLFFSLQLHWFPASGSDSFSAYVLPALAVGLSPVASVTLITRSSMLEVVRQDYIRTARAKGVTEYKVITRHALKNALIPVVTMVGMQLGSIMAGSVVIESIFAIPGLGTLMMAAINTKDYPVIQGSVLFLSISISVMNLLVDVIYGFIDPRIKAVYESAKKKENDRSQAQRGASE